MSFRQISHSWISSAPYAALVVVVIAIYANIFGNAFVYDDLLLIVQNQHVRDGGFSLLTTSIMDGVDVSSKFYRPLQIFLYVLIYHIAGLVPAAYHIPNVALHAVNACLVYGLGRKLAFNPIATFLAALLWAAHPMHSEAIDWISAVPEPLYVCFGLLGILTLFPDFSARRCLRASPLFALALLGKETAVVLPLVAASCLFYVSENPLAPQTYLRTWPLWLLAGAYMVLRFTLLSFGDTLSLSTTGPYATHVLIRVYSFLAALPSYLQLLVWPSGLHVEREFAAVTDPLDGRVILGAIFAAAMLAVIIWARAPRLKPLRWGFFWFFAAFAIYAGIVVPINSRFMEHWMYLPSIGLLLGTMQTIYAYAESRVPPALLKTAAALALIVAAVFGALTYTHNDTWRNEITLFENTLRYNPSSVMAHNNLGIAYADSDDYARAGEQFRMAIQLSDKSLLGHYNLALVLLHESDTAAAAAELRHIIDLDPDFYPAYEQLAGIYDTQDPAQAALLRQKAASIRQKGPLDIMMP